MGQHRKQKTAAGNRLSRVQDEREEASERGTERERGNKREMEGRTSVESQQQLQHLSEVITLPPAATTHMTLH